MSIFAIRSLYICFKTPNARRKKHISKKKYKTLKSCYGYVVFVWPLIKLDIDPCISCVKKIILDRVRKYYVELYFKKIVELIYFKIVKYLLK